MTGTILLAAALFFSLSSVVFFWLERSNAGLSVWGVRIASLAFACVLGASAMLYWLIFQNRFEIAYVWSYSSLELPWAYKAAAFWAGQEGSFLLWLFIHSFVSLLLCRKSRMNGTALAVYMLLQAMLVLLLLAKSPFTAAPELYADGMGLNPLLQDPWMAIHPPVIFMGYALLAVPYAYSAGALLCGKAKTAEEWTRPACRWGLVAWAFLGAGIFIGGYWAYKVLGWGGYWGWDPVENSSLVPWMLATVFLHLLFLSRKRPAVLSMAHLSILFAFSMVLYGTFLTRSGILGDFSVHSFSGTSIGLTLACINGLVLLAGLVLLIVRANMLSGGHMYESLQSREFFILSAMLVFVFLSVIVFIGMSMPLLTQLISKPAAVDTGFYVRTTMPLAVLLLLLLTAASQCTYTKEPVLKPPVWWLAPFAAGAAIAAIVGIREVLPILLAGAGTLAAAVTVYGWRRHHLRSGALIAHLGLSLGLAAIVFSGSGSQTAVAEFSTGESSVVFGHQLIYEGAEFPEGQKEKYYRFRVDGSPYRALTKLRDNGEDAAREPAIVHGIAGDLYIAPSPPEPLSKEFVLTHGKAVFDDLLAIQYEDISIDTDKSAKAGAMLLSAELSITDGTTVEHPILRMHYDISGVRAETVEIFDGIYRLRMTGISEDQRKLRVELLPSAEYEAMRPVSASVSTKPLIWLLWISTVLVVAGCLESARQRR